MRFQYSFQKIVDLKTNEKSQAEWMLTAAAHQLRQEEESLSLLQQERESLQHNLVAAAKATTVSELLLFQSYMGHIDRKITLKHDDMAKARQLVENRQEALTEKMVQEKVWLKARERAWHEHRIGEEKKEQERLDELATTRHKI